MGADIWTKELFDKTVDRIIDVLNGCVSQYDGGFDDVCKYVYVNGGFGDSHYLQARLHEEYNDFTKYKLDMIIPKNPRLSVLDGAMLLAHKEALRYKKKQKVKKIRVENGNKDDTICKVIDVQKCYHCWNGFGQKRMRCTACKRVYYCSATCQKNDWKLH